MTDTALPEVTLSGAEVGQVAAALELTLSALRRNGRTPSAELSQVAVKVTLAIPLYAACLPALLDAAGPQASAAVRAKVSGMTASRAPVRPVFLGSSEAARVASTSGQAIRAAAAAGRLAATKDRTSGQWLIEPGDLQKWMESRRAA